jgi:outer membrane protein OmpA-like peptidoglycan-associated protein
MRFIVLGLSVIFFVLSAIITFRALKLPADEISYQDERIAVSPESNDMIKQLAESQDANKALVADLQATISRLEDQLIEKEKALDEIETPDIDIRLNENEEPLESVDTNATDNTPRTLGVFGGGTFSSGQDVINDIDFSTIENLVKEISASPGSRVIIEGHTDSTRIKPFPGIKYTDNMGLSLLRARAIANILVRHGISLDRLSVVGYGDTRPIAPNNTEEGRAKNRRVEVKLIPEERED